MIDWCNVVPLYYTCKFFATGYYFLHMVMTDCFLTIRDPVGRLELTACFPWVYSHSEIWSECQGSSGDCALVKNSTNLNGWY